MKASLIESRAPLSHFLVLGTLMDDRDADRRHSGARLKLIRAARAAGQDSAFLMTLPDIFPVLLEKAILPKRDGCGCFAEPVTVLRLVLHLDLIHGWGTNDLAAFVGTCEEKHG
ncbi:hypothetical protein LCGC14_2629960 [marine sediment metagenome]|uniref:Uncharacterized protein n=1 Tax=marine sediment metagenome TaxID=412755 RepID=A0A0F9AN62_9ZZZZ